MQGGVHGPWVVLCFQGLALLWESERGEAAHRGEGGALCIVRTDGGMYVQSFIMFQRATPQRPPTRQHAGTTGATCCNAVDEERTGVDAPERSLASSSPSQHVSIFFESRGLPSMFKWQALKG